jgi:hypothetical protein
MQKQGNIFLDIRTALPNVDEKWFIEKFMKSRVRRLLDHASPKFAAMPSPELIDYFMQEETEEDYKRGDEWGGFLPQWVGMMYALLQYEHNIPSAQLIEILPLNEMERLYPALHQLGFAAAAEKISTLSDINRLKEL